MFLRQCAVSGVLALVTTAVPAQTLPPVPAEATHQAESTDKPALIQIRILEGDGAVHTAGTRSNQPLVLFLADEAGRALANASVSARLPEDGPSGVFLSGLRTEVMLSGADGRVAFRGIQWGRVAGSVQIRVTASKGEARAGLISTQYISEPAGSAPRRAAADPVPGRVPTKVQKPSGSKWLLVATLLGAAAAGGAAAAFRGGGGTAPYSVAGPSTSAGPSIGAPSISIGSP